MIPRYTSTAMKVIRPVTSPKTSSFIARRSFTNIALPVSANRTSTRTLVSTPSSSASFNFHPHIAADASAPTPPPSVNDIDPESIINTTSKTVQDLESLAPHELRSMAGAAEPTPKSIAFDRATRIMSMLENEASRPRSYGVEEVGGGIDGYAAHVAREHLDTIRRPNKCLKHTLPPVQAVHL
ncbi:hypothetical protein HDV00_010237 [Rhizophlyctis rosea]|nr:hypothetical protein HDV00_010237 [Rhizophlyctis rosea]